MANKRITQLPAMLNSEITGPALFVIVDAADSTTKKIEATQLDLRWAPYSNVAAAAAAQATADAAISALTGDVTAPTGTGSRAATIANGAVTTNKILDGNVTLAKLAAAVQAALVPSGAMMPFAGSSAPTGWLLCYGQAVSRTTYADLFAAIGTAYGTGDGSTTFNVPDLRGRVPAGKDDMGGSAASRLTSTTMSPDGQTLAATGGAQTHTLTTAELAVHSHSSSLARGSVVSGVTENRAPTGGGSDLGAFSITVDNAGSGNAHNNVQPSLIVNYIIKT